MKLKQLQGLLPSSPRSQTHLLALAFLNALSQPATPGCPPAAALWSDLVQIPDRRLGEALDHACRTCQDRWPHALDGFFDGVDFAAADPDQLRHAIGAVERFADQPGEHPLTRLGTLYQHTRSLNAKQWQGAFFTPWNVALAMAKITSPRPGEFIGDISGCGAGVMLIAALHEVTEQYGPGLAKTITLIGCDIDAETCAVAPASLIVAGPDEHQFFIACGNALAQPIVGRDRADGQLKTINFPHLLGNPPFGTKVRGGEFEHAAARGPLIVPDRVLYRALTVSARELEHVAQHDERPVHRALADTDGRLFTGYQDELRAA